MKHTAKSIDLQRRHTARWLLQASFCALALLVAGCERQSAQHGSERVARGQPSKSGERDDDLTADQAIQLVKAQIDHGSYSVSASTPYTDYEMQRVICGQMEVESDRSAYPHNPELWHCRSADGHPPFVKTSRVPVKRCCKTQTVLLHSSQITFSASPAPDEKWNVRGDYGVLGQQHSATWVVERKTKKVFLPKGG